MQNTTLTTRTRLWASFHLPRRLPNGQMAIMFTDIEGSVAMTRRLGDAHAHEVLRRHNAIVRAELAAHGGIEVKHTGDGFLAAFPSASAAVRCALAIQTGLDAAVDETEGIRVRIGINVGTPVVERGDIFGLAVQTAARLCAAGEAGGILVSRIVRDLIAGCDVRLEPACATMKGFEAPMPVYAVSSGQNCEANASCSSTTPTRSIGAINKRGSTLLGNRRSPRPQPLA